MREVRSDDYNFADWLLLWSIVWVSFDWWLKSVRNFHEYINLYICTVCLLSYSCSSYIFPTLNQSWKEHWATELNKESYYFQPNNDLRKPKNLYVLYMKKYKTHKVNGNKQLSFRSGVQTTTFPPEAFALNALWMYACCKFIAWIKNNKIYW